MSKFPSIAATAGLMFIGITLATASAIAASQVAAEPSTRSSPAAEQEAPEVVGILFYADWCASCKVLDPKLEAIKVELGQEPIVFQRFDMTDDVTTYRSRLLANLLGLGDVFEQNAGKTGFMLLIDPQTKAVVGRLTKDQSEAELSAEIERAIRS